MSLESMIYSDHKNVSAWLVDRNKVDSSLSSPSSSSSASSSSSVLLVNSDNSIDLSNIQKKKLKKAFYQDTKNISSSTSLLCKLNQNHQVINNDNFNLSNLVQTPSHTCKDCLRSFKDINNYKEHRFQEHKVTEFPNVRQCKMCSYATLLKSKFDCHMRCHLNNKVIKCQRCDYSTINIRHMSKHERLHMLNIKNKNEQQHYIQKQNRHKTSKDEVESFHFFNKERKQSLTSNDGSLSCVSSNSSPNTPPWTSCSISTSSQSPSPEQQATSSLIKPSPTSTTTSKTFHNILNLISNNNSKRDSCEIKDGLMVNGSTETSKMPAGEHNHENQTNMDVLQMHQFNSSNFEDCFRSNFENLIKFQLSSNLNASTLYSNIASHHYQQNHPAANLTFSSPIQQIATTIFDYNHHQKQVHDKESEYCEHKCNHRKELASLRKNIFKLLRSIMPQMIATMPGYNHNDLIQIDKLVDTLVQQMNTP